jgi:fructose-1,6-bisphosphatase I
MGEKRISLEDHLHETGVAAELREVLGAIASACDEIAGKVRRARLEDIIGDVGKVNIQGETQQKLDVISNTLLLDSLAACSAVALCGSEEEDDVVVVRPPSDEAPFAVLFDPLDGSSNIDVAAGVGTIFSIVRCEAGAPAEAKSVLQPGRDQVAAGYVLYGSSVLMVLSTGSGVDMLVLDPDGKEFVRVERSLEVPVEKKIRSLNGAYRNDFPEAYQKYLDFTERNGYSSRYIGSMVADVHRTLLKGGVFLYPPTVKAPKGKLRLMYEGNPMSFVIEQAGGRAETGAGRILDLHPTELHQRTVVIMGSSREVEKVTDLL